MSDHLDERMAKAFAALNDDGRRFWLPIIEEEAASVQAARRPALRLIQGGPPATSTTIARASVRAKLHGGTQ
jgi:hypothetical protein